MSVVLEIVCYWKRLLSSGFVLGYKYGRNASEGQREIYSPVQKKRATSMVAHCSCWKSLIDDKDAFEKSDLQASHKHVRRQASRSAAPVVAATVGTCPGECTERERTRRREKTTKFRKDQPHLIGIYI